MADYVLEQDKQGREVTVHDLMMVNLDQIQSVSAVLTNLARPSLHVGDIPHNSPNLDVVISGSKVRPLLEVKGKRGMDVMVDSAFREPVINDQFPTGLDAMTIFGRESFGKSGRTQRNTASRKPTSHGQASDPIASGNGGRAEPALVQGDQVIHWQVPKRRVRYPAWMSLARLLPNSISVQVRRARHTAINTGPLKLVRDRLFRYFVLVGDLFEGQPIARIQSRQFLCRGEGTALTALGDPSAGGRAIERRRHSQPMTRDAERASACRARPFNPAFPSLPSRHVRTFSHLNYSVNYTLTSDVMGVA